MIDQDTAATPALKSEPAHVPAASFASSASGIWIEIFTDLHAVEAANTQRTSMAVAEISQRIKALASAA